MCQFYILWKFTLFLFPKVFFVLLMLALKYKKKQKQKKNTKED